VSTHGQRHKAAIITDVVARQSACAPRPAARPGPAAGRVLAAGCNSPEFKAEASRQSLAAANSRHAADDQAFIDSVSIFWDEDFWKNEDHGFDE
jgi:hypothetical protein